MPNHFHAIVFIVGACGRTPENHTPDAGVRPHAPTRDLGAVINRFKGGVTRRINAVRGENGLPVPVGVWQRNYYERIIRDEAELNATRRYIIENPQNWPNDEHHP